ncbi:MAG: TIGR03905 family TSCPD domain-containing protein [Clostridia bacterium]|nr:TIGR03905 family TSCPD domain-containing protein [Clostridia bacterium]
MEYAYRTKGVCSSEIRFELNGNTVTNVRFIGGCNGNLKAISKLVDGWEATKIISILEGNSCGGRPTSCADQFACALKAALAKSSDS